MKRLLVNCTISLTLGLGLALALLCLLNGAPPVAHADPGDLFASPGGAGTACSQAQPCPLQTALGQSISGDTIYLAAGTYTGSGGAVVTVTKSITLAGGWDSAAAGPIMRDPDTYVSKLDGQGQRRAVYVNGSISAVLDGLHLFNGEADNNQGGAGVYAAIGSNLVLNGCHVYSNTAHIYGVGGGVAIRGSVTMTENRIYGNIVTGTHANGAGIALGIVNSAVLSGNQIYDNISYAPASSLGGGGLLIYRSNATLVNNDIYHNTTSASGGGVHINETSTNKVILENNRIYGNTAKYGGGLIAGDCTVTMTGNLVYDNVGGLGGGLRLLISNVTLVNNVVVDNQGGGGGGIHIGGSDVRMLHTTIAHNDDIGVYVTDFGAPNYSTLAMTNTILVSHTMGILVNPSNAASLEATLWGNDAWANSADWGGTGTIVTDTINIWDDPAFFAPGFFDYHILPTSAAVDAGVNAGVAIDVDGQTRPRDGIYDIGADELNDYTFVYLPLTARDY